MSEREDRLQERLEELRSGTPLEFCQAGLPEDEAALLALASGLGELEYPERDKDAVAQQRLALQTLAADKLAAKESKMGTNSPNTPGQPRRALAERWLFPVGALAGGLALLFLCVLAIVVGGGAAWRALRSDQGGPEQATVAVSESGRGVVPLSSPTVTVASTPGAAVVDSPGLTRTVYLPASALPMSSQNAMLREVQGLVEVQTAGGAWASAGADDILDAGQRVRTGALSGVQVLFYDGSTARLGPETEVSLDKLGQDPADGSRIVELTQWVGESEHDVVPAGDTRAQYQVHTPTGTGQARGTLFQVIVTPARVVRFSVDDGAVAVTHMDITVIVIAGQLTVLHVDLPPSEPVFRVTGEGQVEEVGATWKIAGQVFATDADTVIIGNPQVGDWVSVDGHLASDGTRIADRIVLLRRSPLNRFTISGSVDSIVGETWVVAGQAISVTGQTRVQPGIRVGSLVRAEGAILQDGTLLAHEVRLIAAGPGLPFYLVGIVREIADSGWNISGVVISVTTETVLAPDLKVGDMVAVQGQILPDGTWLARSITRLPASEGKFEFSGFVESMDPWVVSGIAFETEVWTEIKGDIAVGDQVHVEGLIRPDGTWVATEIKLLEEQALLLEFVGQVAGMDPWIVSGIALSVDDHTEIGAGIQVGTWVKVEARLQADGTWLATEIKRLDLPLGLGCVQFAAIVLQVTPEQVVLLDGTVLPLAGVHVQGHIEPNSVILVSACYDADGRMTVISIIVLHRPGPILTPVPTVQPGTPTPEPDRGTVTICHKPGTPAEQTKIVPRSALPGHLGHGDTLGPCGGDDDDHDYDDDDDDDHGKGDEGKKNDDD